MSSHLKETEVDDVVPDEGGVEPHVCQGQAVADQVPDDEGSDRRKRDRETDVPPNHLTPYDSSALRVIGVWGRGGW